MAVRGALRQIRRVGNSVGALTKRQLTKQQLTKQQLTKQQLAGGQIRHRLVRPAAIGIAVVFGVGVLALATKGSVPPKASSRPANGSSATIGIQLTTATTEVEPATEISVPPETIWVEHPITSSAPETTPSATEPPPTSLPLMLTPQLAPQPIPTQPIPTQPIPTQPIPTQPPTQQPVSLAPIAQLPTAAPIQASEPPPPPSGGCHPSYEGACLQVGAGDYDCAGGAGNGPNYTGRVRVVGPDDFGLDRDGDGVGCE